MIPRPLNWESVVLTTSEKADSLNVIAQGLETRFATSLPFSPYAQGTSENFEEFSMAELSQAVSCLPAAAPGHDGVTTKMIKLLFEVAPNGLLDTINYSVQYAWFSPVWRIAKVIPLLKDQTKGYVLDNIRPISLTSNFVKLIERLLNARMVQFVTTRELLSPCQIGFRPGMSIWCAHIDLESRIQLARYQNNMLP